jgi:hypothetical protein
MASEHVLSIPRSDSPGARVILHVSATGPGPLDLRLVATEGASPYVGASEATGIPRAADEN